MFMGPEIFFRPQLLDGKWNKGIHTHIDECIQLCPIDTRRSLYSNIVLSGGSTQTTDMDVRLQNEMHGIVEQRKQGYIDTFGHAAVDVEVNVNRNPFQGNSVFHGGSMMA